jgi:magnesium chelatase family protein
VGVAAVWSFALVGMQALPVRVEAHVRPGLPGVTVVGLPDAAVREAKERIRSGAASCGTPLPTQRITVNLSPADVRKEGPAFDLPVALAVLAGAGHLPSSALEDVGAVGEVSLDGLVRPVRGMLSLTEAARALGLGLFLVPVRGLPEAESAGGQVTVGVRSLAEALRALTDGEFRQRLRQRGLRWCESRRRSAERQSLRRASRPAPPDLADVAGHLQAKRALEIAAAGGHHVLMVGSPGSGKTMLARRLPSLLPALTEPESLEATRVWSVAGLRRPEQGLLTERPFRSPHHTVSRAAMIGGGPLPRPGEVTLAHRGVLFLDELPEFARDVLEALRQPLEDGFVVVSRKSGTSVFPARFTMVGAMNPCPCGFAGHPVRPCVCSPGVVERYRKQVSGPLLDRLDIYIEVPPLSVEMLDAARAGETSTCVRSRVEAAFAFRRAREAASPDGRARESVNPAERPRSSRPHRLEQELGLDPEARGVLRDALARESLGGRGYVRTLDVARTIADLDGLAAVREEHVAEALSLRLALRRSGTP